MASDCRSFDDALNEEEIVCITVMDMCSVLENPDEPVNEGVGLSSIDGFRRSDSVASEREKSGGASNDEEIV
jgi:hypothetical protein